MIIALLGLALATQAQAPADTIKKPMVSEADVAAAYSDPAARELVARARRTRLAQDSALRAYDAKVRQRMSVLASIGRIGPEKLVYRQESAARVQWQRGRGVHIDMTGVRVAIPIAGVPQAERDAVPELATDLELSPVPYFPGSETLWIGGGSAKADIDEKSLIHPLATGAEAWYTYATGDSATFKLPNGDMVRIRELKVRPRIAQFNLAVGSLWFDVASGHLVRATYRLAAPARAGVNVSSSDSTAKAPKIAQFVMKALMGPGSAEISAIVVEYGLYQGRFWLPRVQSMQGHVEMLFARVPVEYENAFEYASVNADLGLSEVHVDSAKFDRPRLARVPLVLTDSAKKAWRDSTLVVYRAAMKARRDSIKAGMHVGSMRQCDTSGVRVISQVRYESKLPVEIRVPCNVDSLTHSADLPASIYDKNDDVFGAADRENAIADALSMSAQAPFSLVHLPPVRTQYGLSLTRYNRVEGLSTGVGLEQEVGAGYSVGALGRFGFSDQIPNGELSINRTNGSATMRVTGYSRLVAANEWGNPLSFGSSISALLFGRDEGFYYRTAGADLQWNTERGVRLDWRAFAEHERSALSTRSGYIPNIAAWEGNYEGASVRYAESFGLDPHGFRAFTNLKLEAAHGDSSFGRGALELTVSHELNDRLSAGLTVAGGSSIGAVPPQKRWFLGGAHTVRGQSADTSQSGNAFWLGRLEIAKQNEGYKLSFFADLGWAGDRDAWRKVGRPLSGAGVGWSMFDGFLRFDVARGIYPAKQTRVNLYLDGRF